MEVEEDREVDEDREVEEDRVNTQIVRRIDSLQAEIAADLN